MSRLGLLWGATVALLGATATMLAATRDARPVSPAMPLEMVPTVFQGWNGSNHVPTDVLPVDPKVPVHLFRTYQNGVQTVWVSVGYYPYQGEGNRAPAQQLLYPGRGWSELRTRPMDIPLDAARSQSIPANLLVLRHGNRSVAILYWYEIRGQSVASDHWYRALLVYNRLVHRRADGALVRVASPVSESVDPMAVVARQTEFIRVFYPELVRRLPR